MRSGQHRRVMGCLSSSEKAYLVADNGVDLLRYALCLGLAQAHAWVARQSESTHVD